MDAHEKDTIDTELKTIKESLEKIFKMQEHKITELELKYSSLKNEFEACKTAYYNHVNSEGAHNP